MVRGVHWCVVCIKVRQPLNTHMNTTPLFPESRTLSWRAILAGTVVALSIHLLLVTLGTGISALAARKVEGDGAVKTLAIGTSIAWSLSALISLWVGGCVAGKTAAAGDAEQGKLHGFIVWSVATVLTFLLMMFGMGGAVAGAAGMVKDTASAAGKVAAEAMPDLARETKTIATGYADEVNVGEKPLTPKARRELGAAMQSLLSADTAERPALRTSTVNVLVSNGMPAPEANAAVDEWITSYDRTKAEIENAAAAAATKTREAAERAAAAAGKASIWVFAAFWVGALASAWGGHCGAVGCGRNLPTSERRAPLPAQ
jgi:hypothetical protein